MTYDAFSGTLNPTQSMALFAVDNHAACSFRRDIVLFTPDSWWRITAMDRN